MLSTLVCSLIQLQLLFLSMWVTPSTLYSHFDASSSLSDPYAMTSRTPSWKTFNFRYSGRKPLKVTLCSETTPALRSVSYYFDENEGIAGYSWLNYTFYILFCTPLELRWLFVQLTYLLNLILVFLSFTFRFAWRLSLFSYLTIFCSSQLNPL